MNKYTNTIIILVGTSIIIGELIAYDQIGFGLFVAFWSALSWFTGATFGYIVRDEYKK